MERVALALMLCLAACAGETPTQAVRALSAAEVLTGTAPEGFARADRPRAFTFPADHGAHPDFQSEWWYVTGHLTNDDGARYGYQVTFFRRALRPDGPARTESAWESNVLWMGHAALLEVEPARFHALERFEREALGLAGAGGEPLVVRVADWTLEGTGRDLFPLRARAGDAPFALDLTLEPTKPLVLHGRDGWSRKGDEPGNSSYYYSATRLSTRGTLRVGEREFAVTGRSWLDREWSTSVLDEGQVGWDWFALQLDDGRELMLYELRLRDGTPSPWSSGTLVERDGTGRALTRDDFELEVLERWTSPASGAVYPARWRLRVPGEDLALELVPLATDAELRLSIRYWEGPAEVRDFGGNRVGRAYVELVGYGDDER
ncbi:MAG TPA: lipocalin-like domain-containing protein [Planctomycetota bacterium]|nr:lipocalin-like domain-containing protein [Planctomycetota bacterium]